jgi:cellulose synthase/poly-beta-1,6-N-acetylglucosamine synthase-like glycosyltransferase
MHMSATIIMMIAMIFFLLIDGICPLNCGMLGILNLGMLGVLNLGMLGVLNLGMLGVLNLGMLGVLNLGMYLDIEE